jgi:hypothetical protein
LPSVGNHGTEKPDAHIFFDFWHHIIRHIGQTEQGLVTEESDNRKKCDHEAAQCQRLPGNTPNGWQVTCPPGARNKANGANHQAQSEGCQHEGDRKDLLQGGLFCGAQKTRQIHVQDARGHHRQYT